MKNYENYKNMHFVDFVDKAHPSPYELMAQFQKEQDLVEGRLLQRAAGLPFKRSYPVEAKHNEGLKNIVQDFKPEKLSTPKYLLTYLLTIITHFEMKKDKDRDIPLELLTN